MSTGPFAHSLNQKPEPEASHQYREWYPRGERELAEKNIKKRREFIELLLKESPEFRS
jgi:hypothetical protein